MLKITETEIWQKMENVMLKIAKTEIIWQKIENLTKLNYENEINNHAF